MLAVNVKGGTGAGRKRPLKERRTNPWLCDCRDDGHRRLHPSYLTRCSRCRKDRP